MPLPGVTPFPPEFAARYRARGYWDDQPLIAPFLKAFADYASRAAVIDDEGSYTYAELAAASERVALNLLDLGLEPADRVVVQLPNTRLFASFYFALQRIGAIPIMALPSHRYRELRQFVALSGAVAAAAPARGKDANFDELHRRVRADNPHLRLSILQGGYPEPAEGYISLEELHERRPGRHTAADLERIAGQIDPDDPAVFQLSGGTTGVPKLIPRTHNDYAFNSRAAVSVCDVHERDVLLDVLPIAHNLPLACPGMQGFLLSGAHRPPVGTPSGPRMCSLRSKAPGHPHPRGPGAADPAGSTTRRRPATTWARSGVIQSGGQRHAAGDPGADRAGVPQRRRAGELRHGGGRC